MKLTIKGMAKKARVSVATISRAMNPETRTQVAPKTLERVDALIRKHAYTPNIAAKLLRRASTKTLGVILPYGPGIFHRSYYIEILAGVADALVGTEYQFKLLLLKGEMPQWDRYDFKAGEGVDGIVVTHWLSFFSTKSVLERLRVPCVVVNDLERGLKAQFVCGDHVAGGRLAAEYLIASGHRRIAVLTGPANSKDSQLRLQGFQQVLRRLNLSVPRERILNGEFQEGRAYEQTDELLRQDPRVSAIFCCNDDMAFGVLRGIQERGLTCPGDISVMGYDNDPRGAASNPPLTTIHVPLYELGKEGAERLVTFLESKKSRSSFVGHTLLPVHLIDRQSVRKISPSS